MRISIIIPSLNAPTIDRTLASLRPQIDSERGDEVIVVGRDDAGLIRPFEGLIWLDTGQPAPPAVARNRGAARAGGDLLCFMDADCEAAPDWLATLRRSFEEPAVMVLGGGVAFDDDNYWTLADNIATFYRYLSTAPAGTREQLPSLNLAIRRSVWSAVGGFDERYPFPAAEDSDWCMRAQMAGFQLRFEPRLMVHHRPARASAGALWRHATRFGAYSVKIDPRYSQDLAWPPALRRWPLLLLASPVLAAAVTARAFAGDRALWTYWRVLPAVYLAKLGWCWGAVGTIRRGAPPR